MAIESSCPSRLRFRWKTLLFLFLPIGVPCMQTALGQESAQFNQVDTSEYVEQDGATTIILNPGQAKKLPFLYSVSAQSLVTISNESVMHEIQLAIRPRKIDDTKQPEQTVTLELLGDGDVIDVQGIAALKAWSTRTSGGRRFVDFQFEETDEEIEIRLLLEDRHPGFDTEMNLTHLAPGGSLGFDSVVRLNADKTIRLEVIRSEGFVELQSEPDQRKLQTSTGGSIALRLSRSTVVQPKVEIQSAELVGRLDESGKHVSFQLISKVAVTEAGSVLPILYGALALDQLPDSKAFHVRLSPTTERPTFEIVFERPGTFDIALDFSAKVNSTPENLRTIDFSVAASPVVPVRLVGFGNVRWSNSVPYAIVPEVIGDADSNGLSSNSDSSRSSNAAAGRPSTAVGYLPASGQVHLEWRDVQQSTEGKLFFSTEGVVETLIGQGMLRQHHRLAYQILQGQLNALEIGIDGDGEIVDVEAENLLAWTIEEVEGKRLLNIQLNRAMPSSGLIHVTSQSQVGEFPSDASCMRLTPRGSIRHSGYVRVANAGSVRIEPKSTSGVTQLPPEQFPAEPLATRQVFVYRFPTSEYELAFAADRILPEISIMHATKYLVSETEFSILSDVELDIREAAVQEWSMEIPDGFSVTAVSGSGIADYSVVSANGSENTAQASNAPEGNGPQLLRIQFVSELAGRHLVQLRMERSIKEAMPSAWKLPPLRFIKAKSVRGEIGIGAEAGLRVAVANTEELVEKPIASFPLRDDTLQLAFRIRDPNWTATLSVQQLPQSIQTDLFHLYSLNQGSIYGSTLVNYFITGSPTSELTLTVPQVLENVTVDGQDIRGWVRNGNSLVITLHQPTMGGYTLLLTFEQKPLEGDASFEAGLIAPVGVQSDRGFIELVSPVQVETAPLVVSDKLLELDPLELPAEFRLLSSSPTLGAWQYTSRPFELRIQTTWFEPGTTVPQVVEFSVANSRISSDGELVTDIVYFVKSRGEQSLRLKLPEEPTRLWAVSINGQPVNARQTDTELLIPLPVGHHPNEPIKIDLRLGTPSDSAMDVRVDLPVVQTPVMKTQWTISADQNYALTAVGGSVLPSANQRSKNGLDWVLNAGLIPLAGIATLILLGVCAVRTSSLFLQFLGLCTVSLAVMICAFYCFDLFHSFQFSSDLRIDIPVLAAGNTVSLDVQNQPWWQSLLHHQGLALIAAGLIALLLAILGSGGIRGLLVFIGFGAASLGMLLQPNGAAIFLASLALLLGCFVVIPRCLGFFKALHQRWFRAKPKTSLSKTSDPDPPSPENTGVVTVGLAILVGSLAFAPTHGFASEPNPHTAAIASQQKWEVQIDAARLTASVQMTLRGMLGDQFVLVASPAVLTDFEGDGVRLSKQHRGNGPQVYLATIVGKNAVSRSDSGDREEEGEGTRSSDELSEEPNGQNTDNSPDETSNSPAPQDYTIRFEYHLEAIRPSDGIPVLTGEAALQSIDLTFDKPSWQIQCDAASVIDSEADQNDERDAKTGRAFLRLRPGKAVVKLSPQARDLSNEETQFYAESRQLFVPGPGVVDGLHQFQINTSQGKVSNLTFKVPPAFTVGSVDGPILSWQFDADSNELNIQIDPAVASRFQILIATQRGLNALPTKLQIEPLRVLGSLGDVGLLGIAFGGEAQADAISEQEMSQANNGDFDNSLAKLANANLFRVYRFSGTKPKIDLSVVEVIPEIRVTSRQVLSFGDERIVLAVKLVTRISRAGVFQLSFALPPDLEVESLSGEDLNRWSEVELDGARSIVLHLNGKTLGSKQFDITLAGNLRDDMQLPNIETTDDSTTQSASQQWNVPIVLVDEALRQKGELIIQPATGIRLRTASRQNVAEADPRELGASGQGALAFRLLSDEANVQLEVERLQPWLSGSLLHEVAIREGQTQSTLSAELNIQNASIRTLRVELPISDPDELMTVRASGDAVSDFEKLENDDNGWLLSFNRRMIGSTQFQIEFENRSDRMATSESIDIVSFPQIKQLSYYCAIRPGGRLDVTQSIVDESWQLIDENSIPSELREQRRSAAPLNYRHLGGTNPLQLRVDQHTLADALKLRVASGELSTILSATGDQITAMDAVVEVIQRSSLAIELPSGGELFSVVVNGESVHTIRNRANPNVWQFYILPGIDDRTAKIQFTYAVSGASLDTLQLISPKLSVPLENVTWNVAVPDGYELLDKSGNMELVDRSIEEIFDRDLYLSKMTRDRNSEQAAASNLLEQANDFLESGQQTRAQWAFNNVANRYGLDAASNEDARVQLENLQSQQAVIGLNTRRQRLYLDNMSVGGASTMMKEQFFQAANANPILMNNDVNFQPNEISQLLAGNSSSENSVLQRIASRLVQHQRALEPPPQAIMVTLPQEGAVYQFKRSVQVSENASLELFLEFRSKRTMGGREWGLAAGLVGLAVLGSALGVGRGRSHS